MRKVRDVLRLRHAWDELAADQRSDGRRQDGGRGGLRRAGVIGITWPVPEDIDDAELDRRLFPVPGEAAALQSGDRLAADARGEEAAQRDAGAAVAVGPRGAGGRLRVQSLCCGRTYVVAAGMSQGLRQFPWLAPHI